MKWIHSCNLVRIHMIWTSIRIPYIILNIWVKLWQLLYLILTLRRLGRRRARFTTTTAHFGITSHVITRILFYLPWRWHNRVVQLLWFDDFLYFKRIIQFLLINLSSSLIIMWFCKINFFYFKNLIILIVWLFFFISLTRFFFF